jgi:hypothetical protein
VLEVIQKARIRESKKFKLQVHSKMKSGERMQKAFLAGLSLFGTAPERLNDPSDFWRVSETVDSNRIPRFMDVVSRLGVD